ncbi:MAG: (2Fe-2S)-binding protein [Proteobacteria bacterium]|nr:(2Fe-2S)-binding protein [Pseudomonadota bacterium]
MAETITITIDDEDIDVEEGANVLKAALEAGICIPNLCYLPELKPTGACRVCIVELEQNGRTSMTASCTLEAKDGMVIHAHSERVLKVRQNIVEMLVAEAPESDVLQTLAERLEVDDIRYPERDNDCVLCGRCVAACKEVAGTGVKGFIGRGTDRAIGFPFHRDDLCQKCYECRDRCPIDIAPSSRRDPCGVCGSELSKNNELIPEICEDCELG